MTEYRIDSKLFKSMVTASVGYLEHNKKVLNDMNVFPVPDGDTGTNMLLTLVSAAKEVNACSDDAPVGKLIEALGVGALRGARGNSGVILSQLFRGYSKVIPSYKDSLSAEDLAKAMEEGVNAAYKAVMKPKEGTILTVAKAMSVAAHKCAVSKEGLVELIEDVLAAGSETLKKTPAMLPILKQAGVVDAGGAGLLVIYRGFRMAIDGEEVPTTLDLTAPEHSFLPTDINEDITFGYCTEFFIKDFKPTKDDNAVEKLRYQLELIGDSLVVVADTDLIKIHVHTDMPGKALQYALRLGQLSNIKIDNMREQHASRSGLSYEGMEKKLFGLVAVSEGEGLGLILKDCNVDALVVGGQSMNPSTESIVKAIESVNAENIFVFPNNKNIILAAEQAKELTDKQITVIPSKSFPQGLSAVLAFQESKTIEENINDMTNALQTVKTGQITHAVRDSGDDIHEGEVIGIFDGEILVHGESLRDITMELIDAMVDEQDSVISIYYGESVAPEEAKLLADTLVEEYEDFDIELYTGGQSLYSFILSVE